MGKIQEPEASDLLFANVFGGAAVESGPFHEGSTVGVMAAFIAAFAAALGPKATLETDMGETPLSFWPILCGLSGSGYKGQAVKAAMRIVEATLKDYKATYVKEGFDSGLGIITGLHERIGESGQQLPMLVIDSEMSKLAKQTRSDYRLNTTLTQLFDGDTLTYKTGKDDLTIVNPHISWIGMIQPDMWLTTKGSAAAATGTWNRFCLLWVKQSKKLPRFPTREAKLRRREMTARIAHRLRLAFAYASGVSDIHVPESVAQRFETYHRPEVERLKDSVPGNQAERAEVYMLRVAALYCIFDKRDVMKTEDFDSALELMRYSAQSTIYLASNPEFIPRTTIASKVLNHVIEFGPCMYTDMTIAIGRSYAADGGYYRAILELDGEVVLYKRPRRPKQKGPIPEELTLKDAPLPEGAEEVDPAARLAASGGKPFDEEEDDAPWSARFAPEDQEPEIVVEATVIREEPESPPEPLKALPAPKRPAPSVKPRTTHTEPPKTPERPTIRKEKTKKVTPKAADAASSSPTGFDPASFF